MRVKTSYVAAQCKRAARRSAAVSTSSRLDPDHRSVEARALADAADMQRGDDGNDEERRKVEHSACKSIAVMEVQVTGGAGKERRAAE